MKVSRENEVVLKSRELLKDLHQGKPPAGILEMQQKFLEIRVIFSKVVNKASK